MSLVMMCLEASGADVSKPIIKIHKEQKRDSVRYYILNEYDKVVSQLTRFEYDIENFDWDLLADIDTDTNYRGQGLATKLINDAFVDARNRNKGLYLLVETKNSTAVRLYKHLGFSIVKNHTMKGKTYLIMAKGSQNKRQFENMNFS